MACVHVSASLLTNSLCWPLWLLHRYTSTTTLVVNQSNALIFLLPVFFTRKYLIFFLLKYDSSPACTTYFLLLHLVAYACFRIKKARENRPAPRAVTCAAHMVRGPRARPASSCTAYIWGHGARPAVTLKKNLCLSSLSSFVCLQLIHNAKPRSHFD